MSQLKARCEKLQHHLVFQKVISDAEVKALRHGRSRDDWWERYAELKSYARRIEWKKRGDVTDTTKVSDDVVELNRIRALLAEPLPVVLESGETIQIHPKSYNAMVLLRALDYTYAWLIGQLDELARVHTPYSPDLIPRCAQRLIELSNKIVAIVTHPGPGYDQKLVDAPLASEYTSLDLLAIQNAFNEINAMRLMALPKLHEKPGAETESTGWSSFFVVMGIKKNIDVGEMMQDHSLAKLIMEAHIYAKSQEVPEKEAS